MKPGTSTSSGVRSPSQASLMTGSTSVSMNALTSAIFFHWASETSPSMS